MHHGEGRWSLVAQSLPGRIGKQCRERWINHVDPNIKVKSLHLLFLSLLICMACSIQFLAAVKPRRRKPPKRCVHRVSQRRTCL
jgi:hypothetical protein